MAINLITWAGQTVTPKDDAIIQDACAGRSGILYGCGVTASGNALTVSAGYGVIKGRLFEITQTAVTVTLPSSGTQAGTLIIRLDLANTAEPIEIAVETGSYTPEQDENANFDSGVYEMVLATFSITSSGISDLEIAETKVPYNRTPVYQTLADMGLSDNTASLSAIRNSMAYNSVALLPSSVLDASSLPQAGASGMLLVIKGDSDSGKILLLSDYGSPSYEMSMRNGEWYGGWMPLPRAEDVYFSMNETITLRLATAGYLTGGNTQIFVSAPLPKKLRTGRHLYYSTGGAKIRQNGKYLVGSGGAYQELMTDLLTTITVYNNEIVVKITSNGYSGVNNDVVGVDGWITLNEG